GRVRGAVSRYAFGIAAAHRHVAGLLCGSVRWPRGAGTGSVGRTMRLGTIAGNLIERIALAAGFVPTPLLDTVVANMLSRTVLAATHLGVFEALGTGPQTATGVAQACGTDAAATAKLLSALVGCRYLRYARGQYRLTPLARKWLLKSSPTSLAD